MRFSIRSLLWLTAIVAISLLVVELRNAQAKQMEANEIASLLTKRLEFLGKMRIFKAASRERCGPSMTTIGINYERVE